MTKKKIKVPFWLVIVSVLMLGVLSSVIVLSFVKKGNERKRIEALPKYTVTFAYQDGTVIEKKDVRDGFGTFPPKFDTENIFRGWSAGINHITSDLEVHPMIYTPIEDNLFYFDTVYVKEGDDFSIELYVTGKVDFVESNLELEYDSEVMKYKSANCESICKISKSGDGKLGISIESDNRITKKTKLATLTFNAKKKDVYSSEITLTSKGASIYAESGEKKPVDSATLNNQIYFLQEVQ